MSGSNKPHGLQSLKDVTFWPLPTLDIEGEEEDGQRRNQRCSENK